MVYDSETFELLHPLTDQAKPVYQKILEDEADRILFKHQHPFRYLYSVLSEKFAKSED